MQAWNGMDMDMRTDTKRPHSRALSINLVDVRHTPGQRVRSDFVAILVTEVCSF